jgi:hypothetical protein
VDSPDRLDAAVARLLRALPTATDVRRLVAFAQVAGLALPHDPTRAFLVESFVEGPPRECDGLVFGDRVRTLGVLEQVVRDGDGFYMEGYLLPADDPGRGEEIAAAAVRAHGLTDTGFAVEMRGEVVIEVNGRLGEDDGFPDLFEAATGWPPFLRFLAGEDGATTHRARCALAYLNRYEPGVVTRVREAPGVTVLRRPGDRIPAPGDPLFSPHLAFALAEDPRSSRAAWREARRRLEAAAVEVAPLP